MGKAFVLGLTGGIGSGKTEALRAFRRLGARTLCLDEIAHRVLARGGAAYAPVRRAFGPEVIGRDGEIDRRALGRAVFASRRLRRRLEGLTHPAILREMRRRVRAHRRGLLVVDAPLLFEAGLEAEFDLTAVVTAGRARRLGRLRRRDGLPVSELRRRMTAQMPLARKARLADVAIGNDGTLGELRRKVRDTHKALELIYGG
ncbi:MAG: dephospho-CoA kinase [Elusimicrobia bacterium]|nr:dephospho-CoA kinase [Elusimicrobiota bacterium]